MKRVAFLTAFCLALVAVPASAQLSVYGGGGGAFPTGDDMDLVGVESGLQLFGGASIDLNERFSVYAEGQWGSHGIEGEPDVTVNPTALMAGLLIGLTGDDAPVSPYIFAGGGLQSVKADDGTETVDDSTFGYQFGGGVGFPLGGVEGFAEARYQAAGFDVDSELGELDFAIFSLAVGFSLALGGS